MIDAPDSIATEWAEMLLVPFYNRDTKRIGRLKHLATSTRAAPIYKHWEVLRDFRG